VYTLTRDRTTGGWLSLDTRSRGRRARRVYLAGTCVAGAAAFLSALAPTLPLLIIVRVLGQVSGAATTPASLAMIAVVYPPDRRLRIMGIWSLTTAGAIVAAGSGTGRFATAFLIAAIPAFLSFVTTWFISPSPGPQAAPAGQATALETAADQA
jgi:MFS family permease